MKKITLILSIPLFMHAATLSTLFNGLKQHAHTKSDEILVLKSETGQDAVHARLYPKINLFGSYDHYTIPTGMIPLPPNDMLKLVKDPSNPSQPFSNDIMRGGVNFTMPLFVKSLYTMADKAEALQKSAKAKKRINLIRNEAVIVGANANLLYLKSLTRSLNAKERSLRETQRTVKLKVSTGRSPESALYKINDQLNQISIAKNNIEIQSKAIISTIQSLTGIALSQPVSMKKISNIHVGEITALDPIKEKLRAQHLGAKAEKEKFYPSVNLHGSYVYSQGEAYNTGSDMHEKYGNIGVNISMPLFAMDQHESLALARLEVRSAQIELDKQREELQAQAEQLHASLPLLKRSKQLYQKSIKDKEKLLKIAKVNYQSGRLSTEEYLRYEDAVVAQKANLYKTIATEWQTLVQLAVIYGNNIEELVR